MCQVSKIPAAVVSQDHGELLHDPAQLYAVLLPIFFCPPSLRLTLFSSVFLSSVFSAPLPHALPLPCSPLSPFFLPEPQPSECASPTGFPLAPLASCPSASSRPSTPSLPNLQPWSALNPSIPHALLCSLPSAP